MSAPPDGDGMYDAKGRWVPKRLIKPIDLLRHELVLELAEKMRAKADADAAWERERIAEIQAFADLSGEDYGVKRGGLKGNITLTSFDGAVKIVRQVAERVTFDERLQVAKKLIDDCIRSWSQDSNIQTRALIEHAFRVDKEGKVSAEQVLGLRRLDIQEPEWLEAMKAIADSAHVTSTAMYVRAYERIANTDKYRSIGSK